MHRYLPLVALLLAGCSGHLLRDKPPMNAPECSGGVCIFRVSIDESRTVCHALLGKATDSCWDPDIKAGWESAPLISSDACLISSTPTQCKADLFGEDW